jgi:hypothetical protein
MTKPFLQIFTNALISRFASSFGTLDTKHQQAWADFGYSDTLTFDMQWSMYRRFGIAKAGIMRPVEKSWQTMPAILEAGDPHEQTEWEKSFELFAKNIYMWNRLRGVDYRNRVGRYAGLIMIVRDGKTLSQPMDRIRPEQFSKFIPVFEGQLFVKDWNQDQTSDAYSEPSMYQFQETAAGDRDPNSVRAVDVHPSRVVIWAEGADDGSIYGVPALEAGFNDLQTMEKIIGAGGEGFWKNSRGSLHIDIDKDANLQQLAQALGTDMTGLPDALEDQIDAFAKGYDKQLLTQAMTSNSTSISMGDPEKPFQVALQDFAASISIPSTILVGMQTGRLASGEDTVEWAQTNMSRRENFLIPQIELTVHRLMEIGAIERKDFVVGWESLLEPTQSDRLGNGEKMSKINAAGLGAGVIPFSSDEIREASGFEAEEEDDGPGDNLDNLDELDKLDEDE